MKINEVLISKTIGTRCNSDSQPQKMILTR